MTSKPLFRLLCCLLASTTAFLPGMNAAQLDPDELIDLDLESAPLDQTLLSFAQISGSQLDLDPAAQGAVTATFESTPWRKVLGAICAEHSLNCEILSGEPPVLRVRTTATTEGAAAQPGYAQGIDMSLKKADLRETLKVFGAIAGREVIVDEGITGTVTIELQDAPWTVVLEEICNLSGCRVEWSETVLRIHPVDDSAARKASAHFAQTPLTEAFETLAALPIFGPLGQPEVELDAGLTGSLTLSLEDVHWLDALNAVCRRAACRWQLTYGAPSRIAVRPIEKGPDQKVQLPAGPTTFGDAAALLARAVQLETHFHPSLDGETGVRFEGGELAWQDAAKALCEQVGCLWAIHEGQLSFRPRYKSLTHRPPAGAEDQPVAVRFFTPAASEPIEGVARFNWTAPIHTFDPGGDDRWLARLSWIPFGPGHHVLMPMVLRCAEGRGTVQLLDPIRLPLSEPVTHQWRGALLELSTPGDTSAATHGTAENVDCSPAAGRIRAHLRRADSGQGGSELDLPTQVGTYLVITPPGAARRPSPTAALIALGRDDHDRGRVALVRPVGGDHAVDVELRTLAIGEDLTERLEGHDGTAFDLTLSYVPD